jgi:hypothetical protein
MFGPAGNVFYQKGSMVDNDDEDADPNDDNTGW